MLYRKKPVVIEAEQWFKNGDHSEDHYPIGEGPFTQTDLERYYEYTQSEGKMVRYYRVPEWHGQTTCKHCDKLMYDHGWIDTLEGGHIVCPGDWVIKGVQGEYYPCKPDIFEATYEKAEPEVTGQVN